MKAMYTTPEVEINQVATNALLDTQMISGLDLKDGGQAGSGVVPKAPRQPF